MATKPSTEKLVRVTCGRCSGSGFHAIGSCFGCGGSGVLVYTAAAYKRNQAAAKRRAAAAEARREAAVARRSAELDAMTREQLLQEIPYMMMTFTGDNGEELVQDWGGEKITVPEMADRMIARRGE